MGVPVDGIDPPGGTQIIPVAMGASTTSTGRGTPAAIPSPPGKSHGPHGPRRETNGDVRAVLRIPQFRRLWLALALSSLGDWMGLLATTALASSLRASFSDKAFAIGSVLIVRLLPALVFGPLAGAVADRLDRRLTMVVADILRFGLFVSIPLVGTLAWLIIASLLIECVSLFWNPAKDASVPRLVPPQRLAAANTISLITTYGTAPLGAAIFSLLATVSRALASRVSFFRTSPLDLALYFNATTFLVSAVVIFTLRGISRADHEGAGPQSGFWSSIIQGWQFVGQNRLVRGLVVGILGGFAAAGCVVALGRLYVQILGGGDSAYGVLFGAVFVGLAVGMALGPRLLADYSRVRLFGLSVTAAGVMLVSVAAAPNLVLACVLVVCVGTFAGIAWVTGYTLLQAKVSDDLRGRTFALVQALVRIDLLVVLAAAPALVGLIGSHHIQLWSDARIRTDGVTIVLFAGGLLAVAVGLFSYRQMDERIGVAVLPELWNALLGRRATPARPRHAGLFIAVEGGEGSGKSTQIKRMRSWLASCGCEVVVTREPGGTALGARLRELLLDPTVRLHPRTEALLYAADRAEHVARVIEPALARGAVVISDRFVDSSIAYQGEGRGLGAGSIAELSQWATRSLLPDVTILLDVPAETGLARVRSRAGVNGSPPRQNADDRGRTTVDSTTEEMPETANTSGAAGTNSIIDEISGTPGATEDNGKNEIKGTREAKGMSETSGIHSAVGTDLGTAPHGDPESPRRHDPRSVAPRVPGGTADRIREAREAEPTEAQAGFDRIESEQLAFHERVREGFRRLADDAPDRYVVLDATRPAEELHAEIRHIVGERLPGGAFPQMTPSA